MTRPTKRVASIELRSDQPTELTSRDLFSWVIWQFPRKMGQGLCGAVKPPDAQHGWYPAEIKRQGKLIVVHGQVTKTFESAEAAADWLETSKA